LSLENGERVWAQMTRDEMQRLRPVAGDLVGVDLSQSRRPGWEPGDFPPVQPASAANMVTINPADEASRRVGVR
jgi:hypothetical protein